MCLLCIKAVVVVVPPGCNGGNVGVYDLLPSGMWIAKGEGCDIHIHEIIGVNTAPAFLCLL